MLVQGFISLMGQSNVANINQPEDIGQKYLEAYDLLIVCSNVMLLGQARTCTLSLIEKISRRSSIKIGVCDFTDDPRLIRLPDNLSQIPCFKLCLVDRIPSLSLPRVLLFHLPTRTLAEQLGLLKEHWGLVKTLRMAQRRHVFPILPSYLEEPNFTPSRVKKYSISFVANLSLEDKLRIRIPILLMERKRMQAFEHAAKVPNSFVRMAVRHKSGLTHAEYLKVISESRASISPHGVGAAGLPFRFFEILYAGSLPIAQGDNSSQRNYFPSDVKALFYKSMKELDMQAKFILENPDLVDEMSRKGREVVMEHHSPLSRARYVLDKTTETWDSMKK